MSFLESIGIGRKLLPQTNYDCGSNWFAYYCYKGSLASMDNYTHYCFILSIKPSIKIL